jgi:KUP system potassium uptake protein
LAMAGAVYALMTTWRDGRQLLATRLRSSMLSTELYLADLLYDPPLKVPGVAVFMAGNPLGTPLALRQNIAHNHVLHEHNIILGVQTAETPYVDAENRLTVEEIGAGFFRATLAYGFMEEPDVASDLNRCAGLDENVDPRGASYFLGKETLLPTGHTGMALWKESLFAFMARNAQPATLFFRLPSDRVVEIGAQVEL